MDFHIYLWVSGALIGALTAVIKNWNRDLSNETERS